MILNNDGFPNFLDVEKRFNLQDKRNKDLCEYFRVMYDRYLSLYQEAACMTPEQINILKKLKSLLYSTYNNEVDYDLSPDQDDLEILDLFKEEPDKQAAVQKLYDTYMSKCAESFKREMQLLFSDLEYKRYI